MEPFQEFGPYVVVEKERLVELEQAEKSVESIVTNGSTQLRAVREELQDARRALAFYADRKNWRKQGYEAKVPALDDHGQKARRVLGIV